MLYEPDHGRIQRWRKLRERIRCLENGPEKLELVRSFGDEIRLFMPDTVNSPTVDRDDIARALEVATVHGAIIGSWLEIDPANPAWPGRDRLFVVRQEDLVTACCVFATMGFFPMEKVADVVDHVDSAASLAVVPGIEEPGAPAESIPDLLWESGLESAKSKKRWRDANLRHDRWANEKWARSPAAWRSSVLLDTADPVTDGCRRLALRRDEAAAGLTAFVKVPRLDAASVAESWEASGWDVRVFNRTDCLGLHQFLLDNVFDRPVAAMIATGGTSQNPRHISRTYARRRESGLLGEMSDEQFSAMLEDSF